MIFNLQAYNPYIAPEIYRFEIIRVTYRRKAVGTRKPNIISVFALHQMARRYGSQSN